MSCRVGLAVCLALLSGAVFAQAYPSRPLRIVVPFTPGTGMDIIARTVGPKLSDRLGPPVVIDNRPGASGNIGAEVVARATPDGHTLLVSGSPLITAAHLYRNVPYEPLTDFAPISLAARGTLMLVSNPVAGINSVAELVSQAKSAPGRITYGSPGIGTPHHLAMELFKDLTATSLLHVPYKGSAGAVSNVLGGEIKVMFLPIHVALPYVKAGRLKALAVGSARRHPAATDLPTLQELGVKGAEVDIWYAFLAPKDTAAAVILVLHAEIRSILSLPQLKADLGVQGMDAVSSTPVELRALMQREDTRWGAVIRRNNIAAE